MDAILAIPPVTRILLGGIGIVSVSCALNIIGPYDVALLWPHVKRHYQVWRVVSSFMYAGSRMDLVFRVLFFYNMSSTLEKMGYVNDTADYAWSTMGIAVLILMINYVTSFPLLFQALLGSVLSQWAIHLPHMPVSIFGLIQVPGVYVPGAMLFLEAIVAGPEAAKIMLVGAVAAYVWHYIRSAPRAPRSRIDARLVAFLAKYVAPRLATPTWFREACGVVRERSTGYGTAFAPLRRGKATTTTGTSSSRRSWLGRGTSSRPAQPDRESIRRATEARLRANMS